MVTPGGVWDVQQHGKWTRLELSVAAFNRLEIQPDCLIHSVIDRGKHAPEYVHGIIRLMVEADVEIVGLR